MSETTVQDRVLHTIFCDDVRNEVGGKLSLMGCYSGELSVPSFPMTLPKLCMHFSFVFDRLRPLSGSLTITLYKSGEALARHEINTEELSPPPEKYARADAGFRMVQGVLAISQIKLEKPEVFQLIAEVQGESIPGPRLWAISNQKLEF